MFRSIEAPYERSAPLLSAPSTKALGWVEVQSDSRVAALGGKLPRSSEAAGWEADMGYWLGMQIVKAYVGQSADPNAAKSWH